MPTDVIIKAYKLEELTGAAQRRAMDTMREWAADHEWWEPVYEDVREEGVAKGFDIEDIRFSGFWSQGNGASWTGRVDMLQFVEAHIDKDSAYFSEDIVLIELIRNGWFDKWAKISRRSYHYVHENTMEIEYEHDEYFADFDYENYEPEESQNILHKLTQGVMAGANAYELARAFDYDINTRMQDWVDEALVQAREFATHIYKRLEEDYEEITNEEHLIDFAGFNNYQFDEEGRVI